MEIEKKKRRMAMDQVNPLYFAKAKQPLETQVNSKYSREIESRTTQATDNPLGAEFLSHSRLKLRKSPVFSPIHSSSQPIL
jgi:hypothetical protein